MEDTYVDNAEIKRKILAYLPANPDKTVIDITDALGVPKARISAVLQRLRKMGTVERMPGPRPDGKKGGLSYIWMMHSTFVERTADKKDATKKPRKSPHNVVRRYVYASLEEKGRATAVEIADELGIDCVHIRKALKHLYDEGKIDRTRGRWFGSESGSPSFIWWVKDDTPIK